VTAHATAAPHRPAEQELGARYLQLIGDGDEPGAIELVTGLLDDGRPAQWILIEVIGRAQARVGELWAADEWTIAREHAATAISDRALAAVAARTTVRAGRGRITVACVDGEWHALPVRILAEMLRLDGWRADFLGASVPGPHLVAHLHQTGPDAVALSCTLSTRLPRAHAAITACRSAGVPVIAGGPGFGPDGRYAGRLGADAWASSAAGAVTRLAHDWPPRMADPSGTAYLGDDEYTHVVRERAVLVGTTMHRLALADPVVAGYDQRARDATAEDLSHVVDFLAAALYVADQAVFTDFVTWTRGVLSARGVPAAALRAGLELLGDQLRDYPRARSFLGAAVEVLAA
jgi:methanogenic corrinoid protein MtbC1